MLSKHLDIVTPVSAHAHVFKQDASDSVTLVYPLSDDGEPDAWW